MSFWGNKKKVLVSSTLYNLAGAVEGRPDFLKSTIFSYVIGDSKRYLGETLSNNYLEGPGMRQRLFFRWADRNDYEGLPSFAIKNTQDVDLNVVSSQLPSPSPTPSGQVTQVQSAVISEGDFIYFAEEHILLNNPTKFNENWICDYDSVAHEINITYEDLTTETISAGVYDPEKNFLIVYYYYYIPTVEGTSTTTAQGSSVSSVPAFPGYSTPVVTDGAVESFVLEERTTTGGVTTVTDTQNVDYTNQLSESSMTIYDGSTGGSIETSARENVLNVTERRVIEVVTTNPAPGTVVENDTLVPIYDYINVETALTYSQVQGGYKMMVYTIGDGNAVLDALYSETVDPNKEFLPYIPLRIDNDSITGSTYDDAKVAYRKAFGQNKFDDLVENVEDNPSLADIDYAYLSFAVSLNTVENSGKKYLYYFFRNLISYQSTTAADINNFTASTTSFGSALDNYDQWLVDQDSASPGPLFGTARPTVPIIEEPKLSTVEMKTDTLPFDNRITWFNVSESVEPGLFDVDAKKGDLKIEKGVPITWSYVRGNNRSGSKTMNSFHIYFQDEDATHKKLTVYGAAHYNFIYKGKSVAISSDEALDDLDESGFLVPMHYPTIKAMGLKDATQMCTANQYVVFNSYEIHKQKWYETLAFKIVLIVAVIAITAVTAGIFAPGAIGILGANAAVGASLGLTGTAAAIAGAAINAVAAIALTQAITYGSKELFGDTIGTIIGAVLSFVVVGGFSGGSFDITNLLNFNSVLSFSSVVANGFQTAINTQTEKTLARLEDKREAYEKENREINAMMADLVGTSGLAFDPMSFIYTSDPIHDPYINETLDGFIDRTMIIGSEVVEMNFSSVYDYPTISRSIKLPPIGGDIGELNQIGSDND